MSALGLFGYCKGVYELDLFQIGSPIALSDAIYTHIHTHAYTRQKTTASPGESKYRGCIWEAYFHIRVISLVYRILLLSYHVGCSAANYYNALANTTAKTATEVKAIILTPTAEPAFLPPPPPPAPLVELVELPPPPVEPLTS